LVGDGKQARKIHLLGKRNSLGELHKIQVHSSAPSITSMVPRKLRLLKIAELSVVKGCSTSLITYFPTPIRVGRWLV